MKKMKKMRMQLLIERDTYDLVSVISKIRGITMSEFFRKSAESEIDSIPASDLTNIKSLIKAQKKGD